MADLDDLLLEAAGRTTASGRKQRQPLRRKRFVISSDSGSDSGDDTSGDDPTYGSRKQQRSQVPSRKRLDRPGKDNDDRQGGSSDKSEIGSDLYKDDNDRERLAQMNELDRETILSDRAQRRDDQQLAERVRGKQKRKVVQSAKETQPPCSYNLRSSARSRERAAAKAALNELRERRLKRGQHKSRDAARGEYSRLRKASFKAENPSEREESGGHSIGKGSDGNGKKDNIGEGKTVDSEVVTYEDINAITIPRSNLVKWVTEPFFDEVIVGCFVRLCIGSLGDKRYYRLCIVKNVDATSTNIEYDLENKRTLKYLNLAWGSAERKWEMAFVSESPATQLEFEQWMVAMKCAGIPLPSQKDVRDKWDAIEKANTYVHSSAIVKQQESKSGSGRPLKIAVEKDRLRRECEAASTQQNESEVQKIRARLQELEDISWVATCRNTRGLKLEAMNMKNRIENFENAYAMKPVNTGLKAGEPGYDPFWRRWMRSRNYCIPKGGETAAALENVGASSKSSKPVGSKGAEEGGAAQEGMGTTTTALEAGAGEGKLVDTSAPVDRGSASHPLHNFELSIDLTKLRMFEGPQAIKRALMARKQKIEATTGVKVPEDDEKSHPHAISISEYRGRRGQP